MKDGLFDFLEVVDDILIFAREAMLQKDIIYEKNIFIQAIRHFLKIRFPFLPYLCLDEVR